MCAPRCAAATPGTSGRRTRSRRRPPAAPSRAGHERRACGAPPRENAYKRLMKAVRGYDQQASNRLRLNTLIRLRWLAIFGQTAAVLIVGYGFSFPLPVSLCFVLIAAAAWLNVVLALRFPAAHRLTPLSALGILMFDATQLAGLLYLTGGLTNPFSVLMTVPVVISATSLPVRMTALL